MSKNILKSTAQHAQGCIKSCYFLTPFFLSFFSHSCIAKATQAGGTDGRLAIVDSQALQDWLIYEFMGYRYANKIHYHFAYV